MVKQLSDFMFDTLIFALTTVDRLFPRGS